MRNDLLFYMQGELTDYLKNKERDIKKKIEGNNSDYILNVSEEDFCKSLVSKYSLEVPMIQEAEIYAEEPKDIDIDVKGDITRGLFPGKHTIAKGVQITVVVPFEGNGELFHYRPSHFNMNPPHGKITGQELRLTYEMIEQDKTELQQNYKRDLSEIKKYLQWVKKDVDQFNNSLKSIVGQFLKQRKKKLLGDKNLVGSLGIPVKRRDQASTTYAIPIIPKKPKFEKPKVTKEHFKPEPVLAAEEYENILEIIENMALAMERSPNTFSRLHEEEIRDFFLVILNGHYEGQATGETFNCGGKTDILIRVNDKNVFIAECKFWAGEKQLTAAIDQLLGYVTWRDTKTAILIFNKAKDFSSVLKKIDDCVESHSCYKRAYSLKSKKLNYETTFGYILHQPDDQNRELILTIIAFDIRK